MLGLARGQRTAIPGRICGSVASVEYAARDFAHGEQPASTGRVKEDARDGSKEPEQEGQTMIDAMTRKPLQVLTDDIAGPYIVVPVSQLDELCELLDRHGIRYEVDENATALDGEPETTFGVRLSRGQGEARLPDRR